MYKFLFLLLIILITNCSKTNLEKINNWLEKEEYEKLLEFSNEKKSNLTEEELYLSSKAISKFQSFLRKKKSEEKYSNKQYFQNLESKTGLKIKIINTDNGNLPTIDDVYEKSITNSKYYKNKQLYMATTAVKPAKAKTNGHSNVENEVKKFMAKVAAKDPNQPEFLQAVMEVAEAVIPFTMEHKKYADAKILELH